MLKNYKDLKVWQKSYELSLEIYRMTTKFPKEEVYGLTVNTDKHCPLFTDIVFPPDQIMLVVAAHL